LVLSTTVEGSGFKDKTNDYFLSGVTKALGTDVKDATVEVFDAINDKPAPAPPKPTFLESYGNLLTQVKY